MHVYTYEAAGADATSDAAGAGAAASDVAAAVGTSDDVLAVDFLLRFKARISPLLMPLLCT